MHLINAKRSRLIVIDFQARLMPAIHDGPRLLANAGRLVAAAKLLEVPIVMTEQNPAGLGATVPELAEAASAITKMSFDACSTPAFIDAIAGDDDLILCGCEAHVCFGQTALSLLEHKRHVFVVQDAVGSRVPESKEVSLRRLERNGAEIVTTEAVVFEWLRTAEHPQFRAALALIK
ncbi:MULTISPECIES: isochorismatase family protein [unclassified Bosea (in: a-proteobacteria)]|uniref:isochorismatase family protein n=1 Tax=unclassified Bosea (in: a-proteobacteria) TaxID=2653178 RepID=UPI000F75BC2D|nr:MULTISPECIES: isochorismatase family protein [unclassified Bosea (in: a-proteobacteria)]AZO81553.1 isochorismatase [Bosea sp. Tri-49]RXT16456.1 isochorismatase [Bosea sp. Tri-39]RXT40156.1 isochorismatase [Bosea sp. Tri-54]